MGSIVAKLTKIGLISPPKFLPDNTQYEVIMGSLAYGVSNDDSDMDVYGWCIPPKDVLFPHLAGVIQGFGTQIQNFEQYQKHHILDKSARSGKGQEYDLSIYNIVKYFQLCMENNPNMIDSLFVPIDCVVHCTEIANILIANRRKFLHKGAWHKFKGYAYAQMHKIRTKEDLTQPCPHCKGTGIAHGDESRTDVCNACNGSKVKEVVAGKRLDIIEKYGYDVKFAYHVIRLLNEIEQILGEGNLDLRRSSEPLKAIRRGEWTLEKIREYFTRKEKELEELYSTSKLQYSSNQDEIKEILLQCLEAHYGNLSGAINLPGAAEKALREIAAIVDRYSVKPAALGSG